MSFELGLSTIFFGEIAPDKLKRLAGSMVRNIEVVWHCQHVNLNQNIVEKTAQILSNNNILCHSLHAPFGEVCNPAAIEADQKSSTKKVYRQCLNYLKTLNGKILIVHPSFGTVTEEKREECLGNSIEILTWLAGECKIFGVSLAVENLHHQQLGNTASELDWIIKATDSEEMGICFDFAHAFVAEGVEKTIQNLESHIITLHLCDNTHPEKEQTCWPMAPKGLVDWKASFRELKNKGYNGVMMYETYGHARPDPDNDEIQQLEQNYRELMRVFKNS